MSVAICALIAVCVITVLLFIPKKLSEPELVFLYFVNTIFALSIFTYFSLNLNWIEVSREVDHSFADLITRLITVPMYMVISTNVLLYDWKWLRWIIAAVLVLGGVFMQKFLIQLGVLTLNHWNIAYTLILFSIYFAFSRIMVWFLRRVVGTGGRLG